RRGVGPRSRARRGRRERVSRRARLARLAAQLRGAGAGGAAGGRRPPPRGRPRRRRLGPGAPPRPPPPGPAAGRAPPPHGPPRGPGAAAPAPVDLGPFEASRAETLARFVVAGGRIGAAAAAGDARLPALLGKLLAWVPAPGRAEPRRGILAAAGRDVLADVDD